MATSLAILFIRIGLLALLKPAWIMQLTRTMRTWDTNIQSKNLTASHHRLLLTYKNKIRGNTDKSLSDAAGWENYSRRLKPPVGDGNPYQTDGCRTPQRGIHGNRGPYQTERELLCALADGET